jgi:hypothetical protein
MIPLPTRRNFHIRVMTLCRVINCVMQGCTNPERQVAVATAFCTAEPNICGSSVGNFFHVTFLASRILRWLLHFWKICTPLALWHRAVWQVGSLYHVVWKAGKLQTSLFRTEQAICTFYCSCQYKHSTSILTVFRLTFTVLDHSYT